jgi:hypothetical protein
LIFHKKIDKTLNINRKGAEPPDREQMKKTPIFILKFTLKRGITEARGMENGFFPMKRLAKNRGSRVIYTI